MAQLINIGLVEKVLGKPLNTTQKANALSVLNSLDAYGAQFGLDKPHRAAQYLAQILHESGRFQYDKEVWGPTPAQERYDTRTDLGNTAAKDGDGFLFRGRTGIQITGKANYIAFRDWCRKNNLPNVPDFEKNPDAVLKDPWEGLVPIWYWSSRNLNALADRGDNEMITRKINGGTNGLDDRLALYTRVALVLLGFGPTAIKDFQAGAKVGGLYSGAVDGLDGPQTRSALHRALAQQSNTPVTAGPVVETVTKAVTPPALDKPVVKTTGFWERIVQIGGLFTAGGFGAFAQDWRIVLILLGALILLSTAGLIWHKRIIDAVKEIKAAVNQS